MLGSVYLNTLNLQRLTLFSKLEIEQTGEEKSRLSCNCDSDDLDDQMNDLVEESFTKSSKLSKNEKSTLYFVSGYVARKENLTTDTNFMKLPESEFTELVSRGKLMHPPAALYGLSQYLLSFLKENAAQNILRKLSI